VSLDQHLKVFDLTGYTLLHDIKYPAPILSAALTQDNTHLIVGMSDGKLSVRQHKSKSVAGVSRIDEMDKLYLDKWKKLAETLPKKLIKNYRYFYRGQYSKLQENEIKLEQEVQRKLKDYDKLLKKFRYWEVLKLSFDMERPEIIVSVIEELAQRNALRESLKNRSPVIFM
jgi:U3 small nucleolar RNA-associated protein 15